MFQADIEAALGEKPRPGARNSSGGGDGSVGLDGELEAMAQRLAAGAAAESALPPALDMPKRTVAGRNSAATSHRSVEASAASVAAPPPAPSPYLPTPLPPLPPPGGYPPGHPHVFRFPPPEPRPPVPGVASTRAAPGSTFGGTDWWGQAAEDNEDDEWADDDDPGYVVLPLSDEEFLRFVEFAAEEQHQKQLAEEEAAEEAATLASAALAAPTPLPPPPPPPPPPGRPPTWSPTSDDADSSLDEDSADSPNSPRRSSSGRQLRSSDRSSSEDRELGGARAEATGARAGLPPRPTPARTPPLSPMGDEGADDSFLSGGGDEGEVVAGGTDGGRSGGSERSIRSKYASITSVQPSGSVPSTGSAFAGGGSSSGVPAATTPERPAGYNASLGSFALKVIFRPNSTGFEDSKDFVAARGSLIAGRYQVEETLGQAAFSTALQCVDLAATGHGDGSGEPLSVCLKVIKNNKDFFDQSLDEIKLLHYLNGSGDPDAHHVLHMYDFFYYKEHLFLVAELLRENLYEFGKFVRESGDAPYFTLPNLKKVARQILEALDFVHRLGLIHCDVKPENIVIRSYSRCEVKLIDFGSSCFTTDHPTTYIQSRSYRAPEVILGLPYDGRIDIWSLGCVVAEQLTGYVLFQNDSVQTMLARIQGVLGPFPEKALAAARDTAKYMTPNNIVYERVRVEPDDPLAAPAPTPEEIEAEVDALPLTELVDLGALAEGFDDLDGEEEDAREQRWQDLVAAAADANRAAMLYAKAEAAMAAQASAAAEQYQYLVVYPKHTTLRHRLHTPNRLFLDFVGHLLTIDHTARPTAAEALQHPWLFSDDEEEAAAERAFEAARWAQEQEPGNGVVDEEGANGGAAPGALLGGGYGAEGNSF